MNETVRESLSALIDDEAGELELERVLSQVGTDQEIRRTWTRYAIAQHSLHGHSVAQPQWDVSARIQQVLVDARPSFQQRSSRPLTGLAVAASVTLTVLVGGWQLARLDRPMPNDTQDRAVASSASPVGMLNSLGANTVQASYGAPAIPALQPVTRSAYQELAQQRLRRYMQEHAEQAALNSPQGLVPFARVPEIRE